MSSLLLALPAASRTSYYSARSSTEYRQPARKTVITPHTIFAIENKNPLGEQCVKALCDRALG
jgi:hypothetical protein